MTGSSFFYGDPAAGPQAMTLSQFTAAIGNAVRMTPALQGAWVVAELSDVRVNGGHCYMELIEKNAAGQTVAKLRATIWANRFAYIRQKFYASTGRDIMTGMKVMLNGAASHHSLYGLSFSVNDIDPSYTLGDMERLRREILERLNREGILNLNKEQPMPVAPQRIAVISASGAAGYGDFMHQIESNPDGFVFYTHLFNAVMQGERTSESVRAAMDYIEQTIDLWDCVAIIRGGGATTDLNGFDDYELARAVATFPLPVVVGIGHERDRTVLDEIAHTRCKTPTAVAAFFIDSLRACRDRAAGLVDWIVRYATDRLQGEARRLANCEAMVPALAKSRLESAKTRLDGLSRLTLAMGQSQTQRASQRLDNMVAIMRQASVNALRREDNRLDSLSKLVDVLCPGNTLKRGYSITRVNGSAVNDAAALKPGDIIETTLHSGIVISEIKK